MNRRWSFGGGEQGFQSRKSPLRCTRLRSHGFFRTLAESPVIGLGDLPGAVSGLPPGGARLLSDLPAEGCALDDVLGEVERRLILQALERAGGVRTAAAKLLGVNLRSFRYRMQKHALQLDDEDPVSSAMESWKPEA